VHCRFREECKQFTAGSGRNVNSILQVQEGM